MNNFFIFVLCAVVGVVTGGAYRAEAADATTTVFVINTVASTTLATTTQATSTVKENQVAVEKRVRELFASTSIMVEIAHCESNFRQFTDSGTPFRGGAGGGMIGVFQFNEKVHTATARALGFDLATLEGNLGYAKQLYKQQGSTPWASCEPEPTTTLDARTALRIELMTKLIGLLQELLKLELAGR